MKKHKIKEKQGIQNSSAGKAVLIVASVASMIDQFNIPNIKLLIELGYDVDVAANFVKGNTCNDEKISELLKLLDELHVDCYQIDFERNVTNISVDIKAFEQLSDVVNGRTKPMNRSGYHYINPEQNISYTFIHSHSPIGGVIGRMIGKRNGIINIYTAHGFHFYDGAPKKNWLICYPVEKALSFITDVLITVNKEDYYRASKHLHAKKTVYIPGVGVDTKKFATCHITREEKRQDLGIPSDSFVLLSVGELQERKNHRIVIEVLNKLRDGRIIYLLVGQGELEDEFKVLISKYKLEENIQILGFRKDIVELCVAADVFVHPSIREGFGISPMEAMAAGLPLISADVNGMKDYTKNGRTGICVDPNDVNAMVTAIRRLQLDLEFRKECGAYNSIKSKEFDIEKIDKIMKKLYRGMLTK